jgi:hypothetical protein
MQRRWRIRICHPGGRAGGAYCRFRFLWSLTLGVVGARCFCRSLLELVHRGDLVHRGRDEALLIGDELQQLRELRLLLPGESRQKGLLMFLSKPGGGAICGLAGFGQVQGMVTPVALVQPALQQAFSFEFIEVAHHATRECSESPGKGALTHAWRSGQDFENARVRRNELQHGQPAGEPRGRVCAELGKQGCRARRRTRLRCCPLVDTCHMYLFCCMGVVRKCFGH